MSRIALAALVCALVAFCGCNPTTLQPGDSINQAYQQGYDAIELEPGSYGDQRIEPKAGHAPTVVYGTGAKLGSLDNNADSIAFNGLDVDAGGQTKVAFHSSGDDVWFRNGRVGNVVDEKGALVSGNGLVIDNVAFHDVLLSSAGAARDVHNECVYAIQVEGIVVRNSTFVNCATMDLMFTYGSWWQPPPPDYGNGTIEGNFFGASRFENSRCCHYYGLLFNGAMPSIHGWTVRNNQFEQDIGIDEPFVGGQRCGNTGPVGAEWKVALLTTNGPEGPFVLARSFERLAGQGLYPAYSVTS